MPGPIGRAPPVARSSAKRWLDLLAPLAWIAPLSALAGCSDDRADQGSAAAGLAAVDPRKLILKTDVGDGEVRAGEKHLVQCRAFAPPPAGSAAGSLGPEVDLPGAATLSAANLQPSGPGAASIAGTQVVFHAVGTYQMRCQVPQFALQDPAGAPLFVVPGWPVQVDTQLLYAVADGPGAPPPSEVAAGTALQFACTAADLYGNSITQGLELASEPAQPQPPAGLVLTPTIAGALEVACAVEGKQDKSPVELTVRADVPRHLHTLLEPPQISAGNASQLTCVGKDAYGNLVNDFPFSLDLAAAVTVKGLYATSTKAGKHKVQCVPETLAWELFTLHPALLDVQPAEPAQLTIQAVPAKQVYKQEEKVQFLSAVRDAYDNLIPEAKVDLSVVSPAKGYKILDEKTVRFALDGTYKLAFVVQAAPSLKAEHSVVVDGTPPLLTIDYPAWGSTLDGKPSVVVKGSAGDQTSGVKTLTLNGKSAYAQIKSCQTDADCPAGTCLAETGLCSVGTWTAQHGAKHGLNRLLAETSDQGGEKAKATRGFYFSGLYYPVDAAKPEAALVPSGLQIFMGKDFWDDGVHDPSKPDDLATLMEVVIAGLDVNSLLPAGGLLSQGDTEVKLSNLKFGKPKISLTPVDGGLTMKIEIPDFKTDVAVKAKQKLGPIPITLKVSGELEMAKITVLTGLGIEVIGGKANTKITKSDAQIEGLKIHVDGLAGLFDFIYNLVLNGFKGQITDALVKALNDQIPPLLQGILQQFAINQSIALPGLLPGQPATSIQLVSKLMDLTFSPKGGIIKIDAGFSAAKGTTHSVLGAIGRGGCMGTVEDAFAIDQSQRLQIAVHDDFINQALYAVWLAGALTQKGLDLGALAGDSASSPFPLDGATLDLDLFLQPMLESCGSANPMAVKLQVGDAFAQVQLPIGDPPLQMGLFMSLEVGAQLALKAGAEGQQQLSIALDKAIEHQIELVSISKEFADSKQTFEDLLVKLLSDQLAKGVPGLDNLKLDLPSLDLGGLLPGLPAGAKIGLQIKKMDRAGGYTSLDASLQ